MHHHPRLLTRPVAAWAALERCFKFEPTLSGGTDIAGGYAGIIEGSLDLRKLADELYGPAVPALPSYAAMATAMDSFYIDAEALT